MLSKLQFKAGINRDTTSYTNTGGWFDSNLVRFRNGFPEKIGGWARVYASQTALSGVCRKMFAWTSLIGTKYTALPTNDRFYVDNSTTILDVTPFRRTLTLGTDPIATTNGSGTIVITDANHGAVIGDTVVLSGATATGNISTAVLNSSAGYFITEILDVNRYKLVVPATANATTTGGGSAVVVGYLYRRGATSNTSIAGWGGGPFGGSTAANFSQLQTNPISTTNGSATITVTTSTAHGASANDSVIFSGLSSVGGIPDYYLNRAYQIASVPSSTTFTVVVLSAATSTVAAGGGSGCLVTIYSATTNTAWGYGSTSIVTTTTSGLWSVDNYGEDIVACQRGTVNSQPLAPNSISTTNGSATVTVTQTNHGFSTGMGVIISGAPAVGGIVATDLNCTQIVTRVDADTFTFVADSEATATSVGGGSNMYTYTSALVYWDVDTSRAMSFSRMGDAYAKKFIPYTASEILVSDVNRHVIAFGCSPFDGTQPVDKMLIRFSDSSDPTNWDASDTTKTAGELRCSAGSYIVTALHNREEILVWTDSALYTMTYVGAPYTYGLQLVGTGFDIIGPTAKSAVGAVAYWMGLNNFYTYNGAVAPMPCDVRDYVFSDINRSAGNNVYCSTDSGNNEIIWFYPSGSSTENNRYVVYNYVDNIWYYGQLARSAWLDRGQYSVPRAMTADGYLFNHETGTDDGTDPNNPAPLDAYIQSSPVEIATGDNYMFVSRVLPDVTFRDTALSLNPKPVVKFIVKTQDFPGGQTYSGDTRDVQRGATATLTVDRFTDQVYTRLRARSVMFRIESDELGVNWRLGTPRLDMRQDGRK